MTVRTRLTREEAAKVGMQVAVTAREDPERYAIRCEPHFDLTFSELNERANRLASTLYAQGLQSCDAVALVCSNRPEYADVWYGLDTCAGMRGRKVHYSQKECYLEALRWDPESESAGGQ